MYTIYDSSDRRKGVNIETLKEAPKLIYRRYMVARLYVVLSIFFSVLAMVFDTTSSYNKAAIITLAPYYLPYITMGICFIAIIDMFINDFAPDKFVFKFLYDYRHIIYMGLSFISFSISVSALDAFGVTMSICRLWLDGTVAACLAILDIFARNRGTSWLNGTFTQ